MRTLPLGPNGPQVSVVGIGAMSFSDFYGPTTDQNSYDVLDACIDLGITHIDTSNVYGMGRSERSIGSFLKSRGTGSRDQFNIATKAGITRDPETGRRHFDNSPEHLTASLDASLERLGIDCVDLFYVHRREAERPIEEVSETLAGLIKSGKTRAVGFSEIAPSSLRRAAAVHPVAAVQSEYSLATRAPDLGLIQTCAELGTTLVAFSPVGRGILTDTPPRADSVAKIAFLASNARFMAPNLAANLAITDRFRALAAEMQYPTSALAIAWTLAQGEHVLPIPGTRSVAHLRELAAGADITLTADDLARIDQVLPVGWSHGDRYSTDQWVGPERFC